ncbi:hypothetical protein A3J44_00100 [candidate division WOR-1 bacterium RIFCSPHIGHO2_02_FULL_45_12]|uniref:Nudix hydrolase domain-containing protein n=1 Tax=candidate division WOR-1 bacterium RIFCSPLOWO2_12_FULL_45_9 TaxID=1802568 RepID=A0A1F4RLR1_UNCSA|nr:MAG: hypothetical protein A3J44_00100 [candidate division WOR-1 bacterium RIFCSPHIGHO2_02_FULL_45_12]OGC08423.1 MAG: hypothetical protein A3F86_04750 [candidate division WOR-1 bacterium RIFCSPLOWO2_12_FULL_45_9]
MKHLIEKHIKSESIYKGHLLGVRKDTVKTPGGREAVRDVVEHPGAVAIVAITDDQELVFVRQFRQPVGEIVLEIPAGVPKKGEAWLDAAKRELKEETGYRAGKIRKIFQAYTTPGYSNEVLEYYLAEDLVQLKPHPDEDEYVEVDLIDLETCVDMVKNGKINDNKTIIGIMIATMADEVRGNPRLKSGE